MVFRPSRKAPEFADLKGILAQSRGIDEALYQVVQEIIERLSEFQFDPTIVVEGGNGGGGSGGATQFATFLTKQDETAALPNSSELIARYGAKLVDVNAKVRAVDLDLEYLGDFAAGPLYSDGDIIVAPDNIAYLCVKPTNDPPVAWPGIGIATAVGPPGPQGPPGIPNPNSTYWLVTPDAELVNARPLSVLGTGYVRSTVGEPSVVATIPLTDTTGILPDDRLTSNVALENIVNQFTRGQKINNAGGDFPRLTLRDVNAAANKKVWEINTIAENLNIWALNDAENAVIASITLGRDGQVNASGLAGTPLNASNLATGTVPLARLGTNAPNAGLFLAGDNTWKPGGAIPSGLIAMFATACPVGWTRVVGLDNRFPMGGSGFGVTGGAGSHRHTVSGNTGTTGAHQHHVSQNAPLSGSVGDSDNNIQMQQGGGAAAGLATILHHHSLNGTAAVNVDTNSAGDHAHSIAFDTDDASSYPPYMTVVYCQKD